MEKKKKYLKLSELEDGKFYRCRLSKNEVIAVANTKDLEGNATSWCITFYSDILGYYQTHFPNDYQLEEL